MQDDTGSTRPGWSAWLRAGLLAACAAGTVLLAAACGGGSRPASPGTSATPGSVQQVDAYASCMRSHGVANFYVTNPASGTGSNSALPVLKLGPTEVVSGVNTRTPQYQSASPACAHILPVRAPDQATVRAILRGLVKAAACMRAHGYPGYPDPQVQNGMPVFPPLPASIDTNSSQFQAAQQTCHAGAAG